MSLPSQFTAFPSHIGYFTVLILILQVMLSIRIFAAGVERSGTQAFGSTGLAKLLAALLIISAAFLAVAFSYSGAFHYQPGTFPLLAAGLAAPVLLGTLLLSFSTVRRTVLALDPTWLMGIQLIRAFGLVFPILYDMGLLPPMFAFGAGYGDIAIGVLAPLAALLYFNRHRWAISFGLIFSIAGILDIFAIAISTYLLTLPGLFPFIDTTVSSDLMNYYPMALIPAFIAPFFVLLHIYTILILWSERNRGAAFNLQPSTSVR